MSFTLKVNYKCLYLDIYFLLYFRDLALEVLRREPEGAFLVRESNSRSSGLALSVRVPLNFHPGGIAHYLVVRAPKGFRIKVMILDYSTKHFTIFEASKFIYQRF